MTNKDRLREYINQDPIYKQYKNNVTDFDDFEAFCIRHCKDIETLLDENDKLVNIIHNANKYIYDEYDSLEPPLSGLIEADELLKILKGEE